MTAYSSYDGVPAVANPRAFILTFLFPTSNLKCLFWIDLLKDIVSILGRLH